MASPIRRVRNILRSIGEWLGQARHGHQDMEALYGPNPNDLSTEERMRDVGGAGARGGVPPIIGGH
jgi:hypothetical protein